MRHKKLFLILALLAAAVQGAWAQASWEEVYAMTNTTSANWTQLNASSTTGKTLGTAGTTTYYYADADLTFTNSTAGGSGMTILGNVYLYLPQGVTVTCTGANANGATGGGAGIELAAENALFLLGKGSVNATGGNAADGCNGTNGGDAGWNSSNYWSGTGGAGGNGGGGAGAGIGTRGGDGGAGGTGAANKTSAWSTDFGRCGSNGEAGATAGAMGALCVSTSFGNVTATGGAAASQGGSAGSAGRSALDDDWTYNYGAAGGGGGGGGGFGGAASNIGTGGPGGGGGGGGASGNLDYASTGYWVVKAPGGKGGQNVDETWAAAGAESILNYNNLNNGQAYSNSSGWSNYDSYVSSQGVGSGGSGSAAGNASISESAINITTNTALPTQEEWDMVCQQTKTSQSQWTALPFGTSKGATIGTAGTTTYYYATGDRTFINAKAGGSGLTILGTVYLFIASGHTVTCKGVNAVGQTGAGAGIELTEGNVLFLLGKGNVNAIGGNAAGGGNGTNGTDAGWDNSNYWSGTGGTGGSGGGGAGAGIGTRGGDGGQGGAGAASVVSAYSTAGGGSGSGGAAGATAGGMGELYVAQSFGSLTATGGAAASRGGSAGSAGISILDDDTSNNYGAAGGGGGGGGGFGGAATDIGTGGPGGGGGGGGTSGNLDWEPTGYRVVKAPGGKGGQNVDGTWAAAGAESILNYNNLNNGQAYSNSSGWNNNDSYTSSQAVGTEGSGGAAGAASTSEQATTVNMKQPTQDEWDMACQQTKTSQSQWIALSLGARKGATLGTAGATTYYYAMGDCTFTNVNAGGSGLTILGTVHLFIASGQTITCTGADASAATGAGAGVELTEGNTLYLIGSGKLVATGGNAANGCNGFKGGDAAYKIAKDVVYDGNGIKSGDGGRGGDGGGGAGAGIGTRGADGGAGGAGGVGKQEFADVTGNVGSNGVGGGTAADMGTLYVYQMAEPTIEAHGGSSGTSGSGGAAGLNAVFRPFDQSAVIIMLAPRKEIHDGSSGTSSSGTLRRSGDYARGKTYSIGGGGGGGAGGFGGAASDIGTGGPGGGGGGGGASGTITYKALPELSYYQVGALGGKGGANADGTPAADGEGTMINSEKTNVKFDEESYKDYTFLGWYDGDNRAAGGEGANPGAASRSGSALIVEAEWPTQGSGTEADPYLISSTNDWNNFASYVNGGMSFSGKYVKLTKDISVTTMASTRIDDDDNKPFSGTFLGNNKTITATIADTGYSGTALFGYINGATIRDLTVAGSIASDRRHMAGLVGFANGTNLIEGCAVTATLNISTDYAGGFVGHGLDSKTTIRGCAFKGTMNSSGNPNVGVIWGWGNDCTPTLENCLEAGTYNSISKMHPMGLQMTAGTMTNCYYVTPQKGAPENACTLSGARQAYAIATAPANIGSLVKDYGTLKTYANGILYDGKYYVAPSDISLADNGDNSTTISNNGGYVADVTLQGRTLYKDGKWNTLYLPFDYDISDLTGVEARMLTAASIEGTTLNLTFSNPVKMLEAGVPYIFKAAKEEGYVDDDAHNLLNPLFYDVTIDATDCSYDNKENGDARVRFIGTYSSTTFTAADNSILLMGGENTLYYPAAGAGIGSCRAYFKIGEDGAAAPRIDGFNINFGEGGNATGIIPVHGVGGNVNGSDAWYMLDGRKVVGKPTQHGIYINNGKKVVIK